MREITLSSGVFLKQAWNNSAFQSLADFALLGFGGVFMQMCAWATSKATLQLWSAQYREGIPGTKHSFRHRITSFEQLICITFLCCPTLILKVTETGWEARKSKCEDPKRNGTWEHTVSRRQRLYENTRNWGTSRTCLHRVRAFRTYILNHLSVYYHAQLNPHTCALKLFCQQSKPGIRLPAGLWQVWGHGHPQLHLSSPLDLPLSSLTSDANLWLLSWEQWKLLMHHCSTEWNICISDATYRLPQGLFL